MTLLVPKIAVHLMAPKLPSVQGKSAGKGGGTFGKLVEGKGKDGELGLGRGKPGLRPGIHGLDADAEEEGLAKPKRRPLEEPALDLTARQAAQMAPPFLGTPAAEPFSGSQVVEAHVRTSLEDLLPQMVRKVAWSGDGRRGTIRLELGEGELAGGTLLVHADQGRIAVHLTAPSGADVAGWRDRIAARLASRGLSVDDVQVE